jgi:hypothetical protein
MAYKMQDVRVQEGRYDEWVGDVFLTDPIINEQNIETSEAVRTKCSQNVALATPIPAELAKFLAHHWKEWVRLDMKIVRREAKTAAVAQPAVQPSAQGAAQPSAQGAAQGAAPCGDFSASVDFLYEHTGTLPLMQSLFRCISDT